MDGQLTGLTRSDNNVTYTTETIKGISYAFFPASDGSYKATYSSACPPLVFSPASGMALPNAPAGANYNHRINTNPNAGQIKTFSLAGAVLNGAAIGASTGVFIWTPTTAGSYSFTIKITDNARRHYKTKKE